MLQGCGRTSASDQFERPCHKRNLTASRSCRIRHHAANHGKEAEADLPQPLPRDNPLASRILRRTANVVSADELEWYLQGPSSAPGTESSILFLIAEIEVLWGSHGVPKRKIYFMRSRHQHCPEILSDRYNPVVICQRTRISSESWMNVCLWYDICETANKTESVTNSNICGEPCVPYRTVPYRVENVPWQCRTVEKKK